MALQKQGTRKDSGSGTDIALTFTLDNKTLAVLYNALVAQGLDTEEKIEAAVATWAIGEGVTLPLFFVHINDDGSLAIAFGEEPDVWPEDEVE